jgi:NADH-quinone oxidoreductase subunit D
MEITRAPQLHASGLELMTVNMGPQHPATHGVLRLELLIDGEVVVKATPHLGYLHRGMEKIAENKTYLQFIPYTDRLDYLAPLSNNVAFAQAVEKLIACEIPPRARAIRVTVCELARISAHLLWLGTHAIDLGAMTIFFYTFQEREYLYDLFEMLTGARLTTTYTRFGGVVRDVPEGWLPAVRTFCDRLPKVVDECEKLLTRNRIWVERTRGVGVMTAAQAKDLGVTGPSLRACGVEWDLRRAQPYLGYETLEFDVPVGEDGDTYDRYLVRLEEMRQSVRILRQVLARFPDGPVMVDDPKLAMPKKDKVLTSMEELIHHFILVTEGFDPPHGEVYSAIEAPKGELGFYLVSEGGRSPYRCRIRPPSFYNLQALPALVEGRLLSDVVAVIASLDPVMGECDR